MTQSDTYIKDIEEYFLSLSGQGIMLSSRDYNKIAEWKQRNVPKEVVLRGLRSAFQDKERNIKIDNKRVDLHSCATYVEDMITLSSDNTPVSTNETQEEKVDNGSKDGYINKLSALIGQSPNRFAKSYYTAMRSKLESISEGNTNLMNELFRIENECLDQAFFTLSADEQSNINDKAQAMLEPRKQQMTQEAYEESLLSFRNDIIKDKFEINELD